MRALTRAQWPRVMHGETARLDLTARGNLNSWKSEWNGRATASGIKAGTEGGREARCKGRGGGGDNADKS
jgi:hypothetical protein